MFSVEFILKKQTDIIVVPAINSSMAGEYFKVNDMTDFMTRAMNTLNMYVGLKQSGLLNTETANMLIRSQLKSDPSKEMAALQNAIAISEMFRSPFPRPDESVDALLQFGITENNIPAGLNPEECHVLIAGQTGSGKSTLLKLIFAQALMLSKGNDNV